MRPEHNTIAWDVYESPFGPLTVRASPRGLAGLHIPGRGGPLNDAQRDPAALAPAITQLDEYFRSGRQAFELPLDLGGSAFLPRVWQELLEIRYGITTTYGRLAESVGRPDIVQAVAAAVGKTPVPIIVPCHRVIAADGALTGYLGGIHRKQALLALESRGVGDPSLPWMCANRQLALL